MCVCVYVCVWERERGVGGRVRGGGEVEGTSGRGCGWMGGRTRTRTRACMSELMLVCRWLCRPTQCTLNPSAVQTADEFYVSLPSWQLQPPFQPLASWPHTLLSLFVPPPILPPTSITFTSPPPPPPPLPSPRHLRVLVTYAYIKPLKAAQRTHQSRHQRGFSSSSVELCSVPPASPSTCKRQSSLAPLHRNSTARASSGLGLNPGNQPRREDSLWAERRRLY